MEALAVRGVYEVSEGKVIVVVFTGSYIRAVAGGVMRCAAGLNKEEKKVKSSGPGCFVPTTGLC